MGEGGCFFFFLIAAESHSKLHQETISDFICFGKKKKCNPGW